MKQTKTKKMVTAALLIAMQIVFVRFLAISGGNSSVRISLGFFPVALAGMTLGPIGGGAVGALADFFGMLLFSRGDVYFVPFTLCEFLYGVGFGLMLGKLKLSGWRLAVCAAVQFVLLNLCLNSVFLYWYYQLVLGKNKGIFVILGSRLLAAAINLPVQILGVCAIEKYLKKPIEKLGW